MKEVIILHHGDGWELCPFDAETWVCNRAYRKSDRVDKLFLMHKQVRENDIPLFDWQEINNEAEKRGFSVLALHDVPIKRAMKYPYAAITKGFKTNYFTSSGCYMIAYAIFQGYEKIRLYGVSFFEGVSDIEDDFYERCGVEYWIGRASGCGVIVEIEPHSNLLQTRTGKPYAEDG